MADEVLSTSVSAPIARSHLVTSQSCKFKDEGQGQRISGLARRLLNVPAAFIHESDTRDPLTSPAEGDGCAKKAKLSTSATAGDCADDSCTYVLAPAIEKEGRTFVVPKHFLQRPLLKPSAPGPLRLHPPAIPSLIRNADALPEQAVSHDVALPHSLPMSNASTNTATESTEKAPRFHRKTTSAPLEQPPGLRQDPTISEPDIYPGTVPGPFTATTQTDKMKGGGFEFAEKRQDVLVRGFFWPPSNTKLILRDSSEASDKGLHASAAHVLQKVVQVKKTDILNSALLTPGRTKSTAGRRESRDLQNAGVFAVPLLPAAKTRSTRPRGQTKTKVSPYRFPANIFDDDAESLGFRSSHRSLPRFSALAKRPQTQPRAARVSSVPLSLTKSNLVDRCAPRTAAANLTRNATTSQMLNAKLILVSKYKSSFSRSAVAAEIGKSDKNDKVSSLSLKEPKNPLKQGGGASNGNWYPGDSAPEKHRKDSPESGACKTTEAAKRALALEEHVKRIYNLKQVSFVTG